MQRQYPIINIALLVVFAMIFFVSAGLSWYKYEYTKSFRYITDEHNVPHRFDISTY